MGRKKIFEYEKKKGYSGPGEKGQPQKPGVPLGFPPRGTRKNSGKERKETSKNQQNRTGGPRLARRYGKEEKEKRKKRFRRLGLGGWGLEFCLVPGPCTQNALQGPEEGGRGRRRGPEKTA